MSSFCLSSSRFDLFPYHVPMVPTTFSASPCPRHLNLSLSNPSHFSRPPKQGTNRTDRDSGGRRRRGLRAHPRRRALLVHEHTPTRFALPPFSGADSGEPATRIFFPPYAAEVTRWVIEPSLCLFLRSLVGTGFVRVFFCLFSLCLIGIR